MCDIEPVCLVSSRVVSVTCGMFLSWGRFMQSAIATWYLLCLLSCYQQYG